MSAGAPSWHYSLGSFGSAADYGRSSTLPDESLVEMLECYDEAESRIMHRLSVDDIVRNTHRPHIVTCSGVTSRENEKVDPPPFVLVGDIVRSA